MRAGGLHAQTRAVRKRSPEVKERKPRAQGDQGLCAQLPVGGSDRHPGTFRNGLAMLRGQAAFPAGRDGELQSHPQGSVNSGKVPLSQGSGANSDSGRPALEVLERTAPAGAGVRAWEEVARPTREGAGEAGSA